jgi:hypothetical protein
MGTPILKHISVPYDFFHCGGKGTRLLHEVGPNAVCFALHIMTYIAWEGNDKINADFVKILSDEHKLEEAELAIALRVCAQQGLFYVKGDYLYSSFLKDQLLRQTRARNKPKRRSLRPSVYRRDQGICCICGEDDDAWEADHIIPISEGGPDSLDNMRTLCVACHRGETRRLRRRLKLVAGGRQ